jgi:hypothetical protein
MNQAQPAPWAAWRDPHDGGRAICDLEGRDMRTGMALALTVAALSLAACGNRAEKVADKEAEAVEATAQGQAEAMNAQADAVRAQADGTTAEPTAELKADAMENQADATKEAGEVQGDAMRDAAKP